MTDPARRFRIRWWHIAIALVVVSSLTLLFIGMSLRSSGRARYLAQVEARHALARPATIEDYLAQAPPVDAAAQEAWDAWSKSASSTWKIPDYDKAAWDAWVVGTGAPPASIVTAVEEQRTVCDPALKLLRRGDLVLSAYGWAATDLPPGRRSLAQAAAVRLPSLMLLRGLAEFLRHDAVLAADPRPALADLDALHRALTLKPGTLIDAMMAIAIGQIRDRAHGDLALRGTLPAEARDRWLAEPGEMLRCVADGFDGEASLFGGGLFVMIDQAGLFSFNQVVGQEMLLNRLGQFFAAPVIWATGFGDAAVTLEVEGAVADRLRGLTATAPPTWAAIQPRLGVLGRIAIPNLVESGVSALESEAGHRRARLAVRLLGLGPLPADQPALLAALGDQAGLAPPGDHLWLRYERLSEARFRLAVDPTSPAPNFDDAARMSGRGAKLGTPAASVPLVWDRSLIELPVPAR